MSCIQTPWPVASLGLVSPGAATDDVTPIFTLKNWRPFLVIAMKVMTFLAVVSSQLHNSHLPTCVLSSVLCKFSHKLFSSGCHPLDSVTRGGPQPGTPLLTPLSMTVLFYFQQCRKKWDKFKKLGEMSPLTLLDDLTIYVRDKAYHDVKYKYFCTSILERRRQHNCVHMSNASRD